MPNTILSMDNINLLRKMQLEIDKLLNYAIYHSQPMIPALKQLISLRDSMTEFLDKSLVHITTWEDKA